MMAISLYASRAINHAQATNVTVAMLQHGYGVRKIGEASGCVIVELPFEHRYRWFALGDNGGEISIQEINASTLYQSVPFDTEPAVTAELTAYRLAAVMTGKPIDWKDIDMLSIAQVLGKEGEPLTINCQRPLLAYTGKEQ